MEVRPGRLVGEVRSLSRGSEVAKSGKRGR